MSSVLHSLNFGIIFGDNAVSKKPRIMHFDFLSRIIYILHKGQIRDAYPFSDILSCNVLAKPYHLELEVTGAQLYVFFITLCRFFVYSLLGFVFVFNHMNLVILSFLYFCEYRNLKIMMILMFVDNFILLLLFFFFDNFSSIVQFI